MILNRAYLNKMKELMPSALIDADNIEDSILRLSYRNPDLFHMLSKETGCNYTEILFTLRATSKQRINSMCKLLEDRHTNLDCSEIADMLYAVSGQVGDICRFQNSDKSFIEVFNKRENIFERFSYHELYVFDNIVWDVTQGICGIKLEDYINHYIKNNCLQIIKIDEDDLRTRYNVTKDIKIVKEIHTYD